MLKSHVFVVKSRLCWVSSTWGVHPPRTAAVKEGLERSEDDAKRDIPKRQRCWRRRHESDQALLPGGLLQLSSWSTWKMTLSNMSYLKVYHYSIHFRMCIFIFNICIYIYMSLYVCILYIYIYIMHLLVP